MSTNTTQYPDTEGSLDESPEIDAAIKRHFTVHFDRGRSAAIRAAATPSLVFEGRTQLSDAGYCRRQANMAALRGDAELVAYWLGYAEQADQLNR